jgi:hypothetical protein
MVFRHQKRNSGAAVRRAVSLASSRIYGQNLIQFGKPLCNLLSCACGASTGSSNEKF